VFLKVAQLESFSRAAQALGMPVSSVSRRVAALESELGVLLLHRTTRKLSLTAQGRAYYRECQEPLNLLLDAERVLTRSQKKAEGLLRISVPVILGQQPFLEFLSAFLVSHPGIKVDLFITNQFHDLVADNIDLAIRFGVLSDSTVVARKLGTSVRYLVATPGYFNSRRAPTEPAQLQDHDCVLMNAKNNETEWELVSGRRKARVRVAGPIATRDFNSAAAFTYRGHGIGLLPSTYCDAPLQAGSLTRLLPQWSSPEIPVQAVYTTRRFVPAKLQACLEALRAWRSPLWISDPTSAHNL
jgi:DNA-binding transcriptional LysR family regulator